MVATPLAVVVGETVPTDADQVTPPFAGSFMTFAVSCAMAPANNMVELEATETVIPDVVTVAEADIEELVTEVALIVTVRMPAGGLLGGV